VNPLFVGEVGEVSVVAVLVDMGDLVSADPAEDFIGDGGLARSGSSRHTDTEGGHEITLPAASGGGGGSV
jgi:hypothetical protein